MLAVDIESTGLNPRTDRMTHVGMYDGNNFEMRTIEGFHVNDEGGIGLEYLNNIIGHNFKFDSSFFWWNHKFDVLHHYDTVLLSQLYDSRVKHSLDNLGQLYLGEGKWGDKKVLQAIKKGEFWMLPQDIQERYLQRDCELTYRLFQFFKDRLPANLFRLYENFDLPVSHAFIDVERNGIAINEELLNEYKQELSERLQCCELELRHSYGDINFNSPKQLLEAIRRTTGIQLSNTNERTLDVVRKYDKRIEQIFEYREIKKYLNTYLDGIGKNGKRTGLLQHIYEGRVYPQYHLAGDYNAGTGRGTETGRTSSSNPNLQNQPRSSSGPINIRNLFIAGTGNILLAMDYSQLELKVAAFLSGERNLLDGDIHQQAADILGVTRNIGKTCNFAILYGAQENKIFYTSGGSNNAKKYIKWFNEKFPKARLWSTNTSRQCKEEGKSRTYLGRTRHLDHPEVGPNSIIQGSAGDIGKEAVYQTNKAGYKIVGFVHDEIIFEVPEREVHEAARDIAHIMTDGLVHHKEIHESVSLEVKVKCGTNWGAMNVLEARV